MLAIGCIGAAVLAPFFALAGGVAILIGVVIGGRLLEAWRIPITATSAVAVVLSATLLLISLDAGSGPECPDSRCGEQTPTMTDQG